MYKLLMLLYWLSAILTLAAFYGMNALSEPVKNDDFGGGNGNPTLVIPFFLMPVIMYFLYGTVELSMRIASKWLTVRSIWLGILISSVYVATVSVYTLKKQMISVPTSWKRKTLSTIQKIFLCSLSFRIIFSLIR